MRYLICGDIHGNLVSLEKLLALEKSNYDVFVCHGDIVNYGPWSAECFQLLETLDDVILLKGNHEEYFIDGTYPGKNIVAKSFFDFCYPRFTYFEGMGKLKDFYSAGKYEIRHTILDMYIYPDTDLSKFQVEKNYIIGHSHYQFRLSLQGREIINTGSLGQNRKYINMCNYVLYDSEANLVDLKCYEHDIDSVIQEMKNRNYPNICIDYYLNKKRYAN